MTKYKIKLTPVDTYFFGGEKHEKQEGQLVANYFVQSLDYPQQTTLLGLLRYYLLTKHPKVFSGNKINDKVVAAKVIGPSSFDYNTGTFDFGIIKKLSPLYFIKGNTPYYFAPFDTFFSMDKGFQLLKDGAMYFAKDHYKLIDQYIASKSGDVLKLGQIISTVPKIGNAKTEKKEDKENKFYKQYSKRLAPGWSFCFDLELEENISEEEDPQFIPFGGEKSFFKLQVIKQDKGEITLPASYSRPVPYLFCVSDCFVNGNVLNDTAFAVNRTVSFRNLVSFVANTERYSGLSISDIKQPKRSNRFNLLQRGSVLYFKDNASMEKAKLMIDNNDPPVSAAKKIGFNHIITYPQK
jgi:CRISPR-associated protein Cmr3